MKTSDFDYELPESAIAAHPVEPRDAARLLVHEIAADRTRHLHVRDLPELLAAGDLMVVNDTRVRPARLLGRRASGGALELLLLEALAGSRWRALVKPAKRLAAGEEFELESGALRGIAIERPRDRGGPGPDWIVELRGGASAEGVDALLERHGRMPLPPYLRKARGEAPEDPADRERYQTVYARTTGAIAAPTAGLHFTPDLLARLEHRGIERAAVTLHVGLGTFQPVEVEDPAQHAMHSEDFVLSGAVESRVRAARERRARVVAIGTTSFRVLESCAEPGRLVRAGSGSTRLFVRPGAAIQVVDVLFTNFHLPRSTLLMLVSAFAGRERVLRLYREALAEGYRFFSYGDAMLLLP
ncbi:MAG: tRNA preQ1(34) S-adenosylmethionine ribosyltransferase-isomerase QueA [Planctomycetota bacterium]|nr:tRNA preQ1(34) S-adenosylmethionine ribosyltransferase-isomerase QueA [Planctomycetota bacterium]